MEACTDQQYTKLYGVDNARTVYGGVVHRCLWDREACTTPFCSIGTKNVKLYGVVYAVGVPNSVRSVRRRWAQGDQAVYAVVGPREYQTVYGVSLSGPYR